MPLSSVLMWRGEGGLAMGPLVSASLAPPRLGDSVWGVTQNIQGDLEATARPTSSLYLGLIAVAGFICTSFIVFQAPARATSGKCLRNSGANPRVWLMSRRALAPSAKVSAGGTGALGVAIALRALSVRC